MEYKQLQLKPGREKPVLNRHPWIFSGGVLNIDEKAQTGDIVAITIGKKTLAYGFLDRESQINARIFHFGEYNKRFDAVYWKNKIVDARQLRQALVVDNQTDTYRLLHAEGDFLPGIIADVYGGNTVVLQLTIPATQRLQSQLTSIITQLGYENVYLKNKSTAGPGASVKEHTLLAGNLDISTPVISREHGLQFLVDIEKGQKTGFFIDQRENRLLLKQLSKGKSVLNTFSYTGGFSVYAIAGGAENVTSVDISKEAVAAAHTNVLHNFPQANHEAIAADCFDYLRETPEGWDVIVLDPPAFAKNAHAVKNASRGYKELNMLAFRKVKKGGLVFTFSCSQHIDAGLFRKIVFAAAADCGLNVRILHQLSQPADHPVNIYHPEGEYLKGLVLYVE